MKSTQLFLILTLFSTFATPAVIDVVDVNISRHIRIVGGSNATNAQFPHAAALFLHLTTGESFCGGSIIHASYILTAAHCLDDLVRIDVQAGSMTIFQGNPQYRATVFPRDTRQHAQYNKETLRNDIGLITLNQPIRFTNGIRAIALPARYLATTSFTGQIPFVVGWGRLSDGK